MVQILCTHLCKWKNVPVETIPGMEEGNLKENTGGGSFKYNNLIYFCKCHNVPPPNTIKETFERKKDSPFNLHSNEDIEYLHNSQNSSFSLEQLIFSSSSNPEPKKISNILCFVIFYVFFSKIS
jgi:hypothetical protein